jgi:DNA repair ATPase RecN
MKINSLKLDNFAKYGQVEVSFDENITYLTGVNGSGKSTIGLTGIWFMFQGIAEKASGGNTPVIGERFRFIGPSSPTAKGEMVLFDEKKNAEIKLIRKLTKSGTELKFEAPEGYNLDQQFLNDLFNVFLIAPKKFIDLSSKQQALALGIDTSSYDIELSKLKQNSTLLNRDMKQFEGLSSSCEPVKEVDVRELNNRKNELLKFNQEQQEKQANIDRMKSGILLLENEVSDIERQIKELEDKKAGLVARITTGKDMIKNADYPKPMILTDDIDKQIEDASSINHQAMVYKEWCKNIELKRSKEDEISVNKQKIKEVEDNRLAFIKDMKLPFKNLSIDDDGGLLLDGKPIRTPYFSAGELLKIVPILMASTNPELKYIFLEDWNLLDEDKQNEVEKYLTGQGFQLVIENVWKKAPDGKNFILLKDNQIVESYEDNTGEKLSI